MFAVVRLWSLPLVVFALTACTQFPELDHTRSETLENADYPALIPIEPILASAAEPGPDTAQTEQNFNARLAALRNRANRIRRQVLTNSERQRLEQGLR